MSVLFFAAPFLVAFSEGHGGGPIETRLADCLTADERRSAEEAVQSFGKEHAGRGTASQSPYLVYPFGGVLGEDVFPNNYVDLDPTSGLKDWDCSNYTYDGHLGIDLDIKGFGEKAVGVPVFAPLDGTVVQTNDGEFDENTFGDGLPGNHVILYHSDTHYSLYWHLKRGSVGVKVGDSVRAGQQIGLMASSGNSTGPHLHFESWAGAGSSFAYDPHTGPCNPGQSGFVSQRPVPRSFYLRDFNVSPGIYEHYPGLPFDLPRTGTFATGVRSVGFWALVQNLPTNSVWKVRFVRANGSVAYDSGNQAWNNPFYRQSSWWWRYNVNLNATGEWKTELWINDQLSVSAPFRVRSTTELNNNRPPHAVTIVIDKPPVQGGPLSARITSPLLLDDPDYDIVRYRYVWKQFGTVVRDVVSAGHLDMIPGSAYVPTKDVTVSVTPSDGLADGPVTTVHSLLQGKTP
ncbi:MAG: M23 family metallopeptidase [Armatimonadetes bacterium]|nr:M23 family metallopeptidase [Armatimonadota bacterium]